VSEADASTDQETRVPDHPSSRATVEEVRAWVAERRLATTVLGGLLVTSLLFWGALLVATGGDRTSSLVAGSPREDDPAASSAPDDGDTLTRGLEGPTDDDQVAPTDESDGEDGEDAPTDEPTDAPTDEPDGEDPADAEAEEDGEPEGTVVLDLDGRCEVEVDAADEDDPRVHQPWRHPECVLAPLDPTHPDERWIVILSSFSGEQAARAEAEARAAGSEPKLLWSSHYPSLRPDLWVVYEGPFRDRATAIATADELGPGAYPRYLRPQAPSDEVPPGR
jgi:hypothetical protein